MKMLNKARSQVDTSQSIISQAVVTTSYSQQTTTEQKTTTEQTTTQQTTSSTQQTTTQQGDQQGTTTQQNEHHTSSSGFGTVSTEQQSSTHVESSQQVDSLIDGGLGMAGQGVSQEQGDLDDIPGNLSAEAQALLGMAAGSAGGDGPGPLSQIKRLSRSVKVKMKLDPRILNSPCPDGKRDFIYD